MLRSVYRVTLWERRVAILWWLAGVIAVTAFVVALFPTVSQSAGIQEVMQAFPPEFLTLFGIDPAVFQTAAGYLQAHFYSFAAPILLVVLGVRLGTRATAGEEQAGTIDLLLANPVSRARVVVEKLAAMVTLTALVAAGIAAVLVAGNVLADLGLSVLGIVGMNLGLLLVSLLFGAAAAAAGAWLGRPGLAAGIAGGLAAVAFVVDGFAPLVEQLRGLQRLSPFYWYQAGGPLLAGPTVHHAALGAAVLVLAGVAVVGFQRRDLSVYGRLLPHLVHGRQRGRRRLRLAFLLGTVYAKTIWERRVSFWWWLGGLVALTAATVSFWPTVAAGQDALSGLIDALPREFLALLGFADAQLLLTPAGFVSSRVYAGVGLIVVIAFAIGMGSAAVAGEEADGTLDLLLANPIPRARVIIEKFLAMATLVTLIALALLAVLLAGDPMVGLGLDAEGMLAASVGLVLLALLFGGVALATGAATGRPGAAAGVAGGLAAATYVLNGLGAIVDLLAPARLLSPFYWYLGDGTPLASGFNLSFLLLAAGAAVLPAVAVAGFRGRSIAA